MSPSKKNDYPSIDEVLDPRFRHAMAPETNSSTTAASDSSSSTLDMAQTQQSRVSPLTGRTLGKRIDSLGGEQDTEPRDAGKEEAASPTIIESPPTPAPDSIQQAGVEPSIYDIKVVDFGAQGGPKRYIRDGYVPPDFKSEEVGSGEKERKKGGFGRR
jgi:hypothetical protein